MHMAKFLRAFVAKKNLEILYLSLETAKPLCYDLYYEVRKVMKVKCITNECIDLIEGKIYEAQIEYFHGHKMLCIKDESGDYYLYSMQDFEIIEDYV